jgi:hypothetical protein
MIDAKDIDSYELLELNRSYYGEVFSITIKCLKCRSITGVF